MGPMLTLPSFYIFSLLDFSHNGCVILTMILFLYCICFPLLTNFSLLYVLYVAFCPCNALLLVIVRIGHLDKSEIFGGIGSKTLVVFCEIEN